MSFNNIQISRSVLVAMGLLQILEGLLHLGGGNQFKSAAFQLGGNDRHDKFAPLLAAGCQEALSDQPRNAVAQLDADAGRHGFPCSFKLSLDARSDFLAVDDDVIHGTDNNSLRQNRSEDARFPYGQAVGHH